jgi:hypothetical protein
VTSSLPQTADPDDRPGTDAAEKWSG